VSEIVEVVDDQREALVERAAATLRDGELVVLPTDTVYGVVADAFNLDGTSRLFAARRQRRSAPLPVMVRSPKQLIGLTPAVPEAAERLMAAFWPGALTIVVPAEPNLRWELGRAEGTLAVRMPLDDLALEVVSAVGPLALTSACRVGEPPPLDAAAAQASLGAAVALYLDDGPRGEARSSVVDLTRAAPQMLRTGSLPDDVVLEVARGELDPLEAATRVASVAAAADEPAAGEADERHEEGADGTDGEEPASEP
jgi:L-threonylcarbamoyladenylate synthase